LKVCPECERQFPNETRVCPDDGNTLFVVPDANSDPMHGTTLDGRFLIVDTIGSGGMGTVYRGRQLSMDRDVAIKVVRRDLAHNAKVVKRFMREARVVSRLRSPHVVPVIDFGQSPDGVLFLVMELLHGESMTMVLARDAPMNQARLCTLLAQTCDALAEAHGQGLVHRDLKPDNIYVSKTPAGQEHCYILDFGIVRAGPGGKGEDPSLTTQGIVIGTPQFMAPEQIRAQDVSPQTDLYSIGVIAYYGIAGKLPFEGETPTSVFVETLTKPVPRLPDRVAGQDVDPQVRNLIYRMLEKDAKNRPQSTVEVQKILLEVASRKRADSAEGREDVTSGATSMMDVVIAPRPSGTAPMAAPTPPYTQGQARSASDKKLITPSPDESHAQAQTQAPARDASSAGIARPVAPRPAQGGAGSPGSSAGAPRRGKEQQYHADSATVVGVDVPDALRNASLAPAVVAHSKATTVPKPKVGGYDPEKSQIVLPESGKKRSKAGLWIGLGVGLAAAAGVAVFALLGGAESAGGAAGDRGGAPAGATAQSGASPAESGTTAVKVGGATEGPGTPVAPAGGPDAGSQGAATDAKPHASAQAPGQAPGSSNDEVRVRIETQPPGAKAFEGSKYVDTTPFEIRSPKNASGRNLRLSLDGYRDGFASITFDRSRTESIALAEKDDGRSDPVAKKKKSAGGPKAERPKGDKAEKKPKPGGGGLDDI